MLAKQDLIDQYKRQILLPWYLTDNWDSFDECFSE